MASDDRSRFLIALAKFLGANPTEEHPLANVIVCERWLIDEVLDDIFSNEGQLRLDSAKFNRLMLNCGHGLATDHFYKHFFEGVNTLESFEGAVEAYRIKAMLLFGNFEFGYKKIATSDKNAFEALMRKTERVGADKYESRSEFLDIEDIPVEDLPLLGYISSGELDDLDFAAKLMQILLEVPDARARVLAALGVRRGKVSDLLDNYGPTFPRGQDATLDTKSLQKLAEELAQIHSSMKARHKEAVAIGIRNTQRYLALPYLDVYVATSMRTREDYVDQHDFIKRVFSAPEIAALKLRYFDPTVSYVDDRISKGIVEMLMLQRATVTIYNAGKEDTLGKDSELAATLAQGKSVIVYVPSDPSMDKRAETFRVGHPLGLQIDLRTGVAHGVTVVRTPKQCAEMLRKVILHEQTFTIRHENGNFLLEDIDTRSVTRIVSDDLFLTHAFWTYFHRSGLATTR